MGTEMVATNQERLLAECRALEAIRERIVDLVEVAGDAGDRTAKLRLSRAQRAVDDAWLAIYQTWRDRHEADGRGQ